MKRFVVVASALMSTLVAGRGAAQTTINTIPDSVTVFSGGGHSDPRGEFWGQTFTVPNPTDVFLNSFTIGFATGNPVSVVGRLMQFNSVFPEPVGSVLFQSAVGTTSSDLQFVRYDLGGIPLTFGSQYVFFVQFGGNSGGVDVAYNLENVYAGGRAVQTYAFNFHDNWPTESFRTGGGSWGYWEQGYDLAFQAEFGPAATTIPEPATMILLGSGLAGLGALNRRRRTKAEKG
jgi:hypothetical protein